ncbi:MAG: hypothetical protein H0W61_17800 [Bacteroidetes bacterium]|nr:hypothetical protein [Bacteroidota bacterium]
MHEDNVLKQVKINEATVTLRRDGIVHVLFHKNITLGLGLQMLLLNIYNEITERKKHPFIFEAFEGVRVTREAKNNAIRIEDDAPGCAYAVVAKSLAYKIIAGFYLQVKKPKSPYKVFSEKEEAIEWLKQFLPSAENANNAD